MAKLIIIAEMTNTMVRINTPRNGPLVTLLKTALNSPKLQFSGFHCGIASRKIGSIEPNATHATA